MIRGELQGLVVLVTDVDRRKSIPLIRSLGRAGATVVGLSYASFPMGGMSRYCKETFRCPDYRTNKAEFESFLGAICSTKRPDVLIPIEEQVVEICVNRPDVWKPYTSALLPEADVLELTYDKWKTLCVAAESEIPTPRSYCPSSYQDLRAVVDSWKGGAVVKPRKSSGSRGLRFVRDGGELRSAYDDVSKKYPRPVIQERLDPSGPGLGVFVLMGRGHEVLASFGHKRIREYPISGGPSTLRMSYKDPELIRKTIEFLRRIKFSGIAMVEYKVDVRTNTPLLMEVNPRFWGSLELAVASGVDFPVLYCKAALGMNIPPRTEFHEGVYARWLIPGDILHFLKSPNRLRLKPSFFKFFGRNLVYDELSLSDPLPILGLILESVRRVLRG